jgi:hypothetical protein
MLLTPEYTLAQFGTLPAGHSDPRTAGMRVNREGMEQKFVPVEQMREPVPNAGRPLQQAALNLTYFVFSVTPSTPKSAVHRGC